MLKLLAILLVVYFIYKFIASILSKVVFIQNQNIKEDHFGLGRNEKDISDRARVIEDDK